MPRQFVYRIGGSSTVLTQAEIDNNILCIYDQLAGNYNWSKKAIAGACGCFYEESKMNPGVYESSHGGNLNNLPYFPGGMGLAQWTDYPAYTSQYPNPLPWAAQRDGYNWYDGIFQCYLMTKATDPTYTDMGYGQGARWGWQTSSSYPSTPFSSYIVNENMSVRDAVTYWFYDFEWHYSVIPEWVDFEARVQWGEYAYRLINGETPQPPGPGPGPSHSGDVRGFVEWCVQKCEDANVGYSQQYREEQTVSGITYYDCSSFVWYGLKHNDFDINATSHPTYAFDTTQMPTDLALMGFVEVDRTGELLPGDIGVNPNHTEVVYEGGTGQAKFMGAHSANVPLPQQVSINNYITPGTSFASIWRFMGGSPVPPTPTGRKKLPLWMMIKRLPF